MGLAFLFIITCGRSRMTVDSYIPTISGWGTSGLVRCRLYNVLGVFIPAQKKLRGGKGDVLLGGTLQDKSMVRIVPARRCGGLLWGGRGAGGNCACWTLRVPNKKEVVQPSTASECLRKRKRYSNALQPRYHAMIYTKIRILPRVVLQRVRPRAPNLGLLFFSRIPDIPQMQNISPSRRTGLGVCTLPVQPG